MVRIWRYLFPLGDLPSQTEQEVLGRLTSSFPDIHQRYRTECSADDDNNNNNNHQNGNKSKGRHIQSLVLKWKWKRSRHKGCVIPYKPELLDPLWTLSQITYLNLDNCPCPLDGIGKLTTLKTLFLGLVPSIPEEIGLLRDLEALTLQNCDECVVRVCIRQLSHVMDISVLYSGYCTCLGNCLLRLKEFPNLQRLCLYNISRSTIFDLFEEQPWDGRSSVVEVLELSNCFLGNDYGRLLRGLPASLKKLVLDSNNITTLKPFLDGGLPRGIQKLRLAVNPIELYNNKCQLRCFHELLDSYPRLGHVFITSDFPHWKELEFQRLVYKMLLNQIGRVCLLSGDDNGCGPIPLSVWPLILERAANSDTARAKEGEDSFYALLGSSSRRSNRAADPYARKNKCQKFDELCASALYSLVRAYPIWMTSR